MAEAALLKAPKGWFLGLGRDGDRTLDLQLIGLNKLLDEVEGKTVIDAGCAEGLISLELARRGAARCTGLEIIPGYVDIGNGLAAERDLPCRFVQANLNEYDVTVLHQADIVLMLAVLHKLRDPSLVCGRLADLARDLCVIRLPPYGTTIVDDRSFRKPHDIAAVMAARGFHLEQVEAGPFDEWMGYYRRRK